MNVAAWVERHGRRWTDDPALTDGDRVHATGGAFAARTAAAAADLRESFGLSPGDRVAIVMRNRPALTDDWADRRRRNQPPPDRSTLRLLKAQYGRCMVCADLLLHADRPPHTPEEWHRWHRPTRKAITRQHIIANGQDDRPDDDIRLGPHPLPTPNHQHRQRPTNHLHLPEPPHGLPEPDAADTAR